MSPNLPAGDRKDILKDALLAIERLKAKLAVYEKADREPIAIIGAGCRFPGDVRDLNSYWELLRQGKFAVEAVPAERWELVGRGRFDDQFHAGQLNEIDKFDPSFFGISPREAVTMDPQQRLVLEVAWEALENAGQAPSELAGTRTGVFLGVSASDYVEAVRAGEGFNNIYAATGTSHAVVAGRLSYVLGLQGPAIALDTACSSSLVTIHLACQSLRTGESSMAIAGGVNVLFDPRLFRCLNGWGMMAPDGICKTFDTDANGFVRSDGCGLVVLKRLSDAVANGDNILALIRSSAINHDGRSSGLTVPNGIAQEKLIRLALERGGVHPHDIQYVEAHGTGTSLGDPIEVQAIEKVLGYGRPADRPLYLGSVKTNLGHMESAAGVGGLLKAVLALQHGIIPKHLHFKEWNPMIPLSGAPVIVPANEAEWPAAERRIAAVSAFGFSGTNAHVVLEQAPVLESSTTANIERPLHVMAVSARTRTAALQLMESHERYLLAHPEMSAADVCFTLNAGRSHHPYRVACTGRSSTELAAALREARDAGKPPSRAHQNPRIAFLFTGQGSHYAGMARQLAATQPVFRSALDRCAAILNGLLDCTLDELLFGAGSERLAQTGYAQPALFALEFALAELWRSWGIQPSFMIGHSLGEYVAACVGGVFPLEPALRLVARRGKLMQALPAGGRMASVSAPEPAVQQAIDGLPLAAIAAVNGPESIVISGAAADVETAVDRLQKQGYRCQWLNVSHAFHSPLLEPMLRALEQEASGIPHTEPGVPLISNVTGEIFEPGSLTPDYWRRHAWKPVQFRRGVEAIRRAGADIFIEIGPGSTLIGLAREFCQEESLVWAPSLSSRKEDWQQLLESVSVLYEHGVDLDWDAFDAPYRRRRVPLPSYPWERQRYWPSTSQHGYKSDIAETTLSKRRISSPCFPGEAWEYRLSPDDPTIVDHRIRGKVLLPLTGFLQLIRDAGVVGVQDFTIEQPLELEHERAVTAQVTIDRGHVCLYSLNGEQWLRHADGKVLSTRPTGSDVLEDFSALKRRIDEPLDMDGFYERMHGVGLEYGETYQLLTSLWLNNDEALGKVSGSGNYMAALDACLHVLFPLIERRMRGLLLPVSVDSVEFHSNLDGMLWVHARLNTLTAETIAADLDVRRDDGQLACRIRGFRARKTGSEARSLIHEIVSHEAPLPETATVMPGGSWLVVADTGVVHEELSGALLQAGANCLVVRPSELEESSVRQSNWRGVVYLAGLDATTTTEAIGGIYDLLRKLHSAQTGVRLWIVTRCSQPVADTRVDCVQAPVWGMGRCLALEHPDWRCTMVDIDTSGGGSSLARELLGGSNDVMSAWRNGMRYTPRLVRQQSLGTTPRKLVIGTPGVLEDLEYVLTDRRTPQPDEVEIRVAATGLNFRDVLTTLGLIPVLPSGLGGECSGVVERVGADVRDFSPGDEVMALAGSSFGTYVTVNQGLVARKPENITFVEAAGLPAVFGTCMFALERVAQLKSGETVLIHSATGGVGLAALEVARRSGAVVLATAGSERKRQYLRDLGVQHVFDSRSPSFSGEVMKVTGGRGVDIVLNSLSGELISAGLQATATGGRFIELGKRGIWTKEDVAAVRPDVEYHVFDLGTYVAANPDDTREMICELSRRVGSHEFHALPVRMFSYREVTDAFRTMAQAAHIGKIVVAQAGYAAAYHRNAQSSGAYLVTGGLGALGLQTAEWLSKEGARTLVLVGRRSPSPTASEVIDRLRQANVRVEVRLMDVTDRTQVQKLLTEIRRHMGPLRGIFHAAGVLDDGLAVDQNWERARAVLAPKITGATHLHELTGEDPLDFFVLYSSSSAVMGSPGQASYAAGNAYLDALAHARRQNGLTATSINWGAWASAGMAAEAGPQQIARWRSAGLEPLESSEAFSTLKLAFESVSPQVTVINMNWDLFGQQVATRQDAAFFAEVTQPARKTAGLEEADLVERIWKAPREQRVTLVSEFLETQVRRVLALPTAFVIEPTHSLQQLGLDSVMAVELRTRIDRGLHVRLTTVALLESFSICDLAADVLAKVPPPGGGTNGDAPTAGLDGLVDAIPDAEVDTLLQHILGQAPIAP